MGKKFSELERASSLNNGDLFAVAQIDAQAQTGYKSKSTETSAVAQKLLKGIEFPTDLQTDDKTVLGAINEVNSRTIAYDVVSGPIASFKTSLELPIKSLGIDINAVQAAGTPTPASPLPISGWSAITLDVNGDTEVINLGGTYYGGHFTQDKDGHRQFVVDKQLLVVDGVNVYGEIGGTYMNIKPNNTVSAPFFNATSATLWKSNMFVCSASTMGYNQPNGFMFLREATWQSLGVANATEFNNYCQNTPIIFLYPLDTPIIIDLPDGEPIITLNGTNNIYADSGDASVEYALTIEEYINKKIAEVQALILNS